MQAAPKIAGKISWSGCSEVNSNRLATQAKAADNPCRCVARYGDAKTAFAHSAGMTINTSQSIAATCLFSMTAIGNAPSR